MKQRKFIVAVIAALIAGQALALDVGSSTQASPEAVAVPHEITLQHEFVEQFKLFDDTRFQPLSKFVRDVAPQLTAPGMTATIIARNDAEASLVASTYRRYGATVNFATAIDPGAKLVTIKIYQN
jgi:hypothetical protein